MTTIIPIGGNINEKKPVVLREFVRRAGGESADIVILPQTSALADSGAYYTKIFLDLGACAARSLEFRNRAESTADAFIDAVRTASGIFICGGVQMRLTTMIGGTPFESALLEAFHRGCVFAGTSAGAAVMPTVMTADGKSGPTPRHRMSQVVRGLGLTEQFAIDQHFRQRDRLGRLLYLIAANPGLIGLGIDEDTAAIIEDDAWVTVAGTGAVTVIDGNGITATDVAEVENSRPVAVSDIRIHVLTAGCAYDARARTATIPSKIHTL